MRVIHESHPWESSIIVIHESNPWKSSVTGHDTPLLRLKTVFSKIIIMSDSQRMINFNLQLLWYIGIVHLFASMCSFGFVIETFPSKYDCKYCCLKFKPPCVATFKKSIVGVLRNRMVVAWKHGEGGGGGSQSLVNLRTMHFCHSFPLWWMALF